jgi:GGDEF domain-containing protein
VAVGTAMSPPAATADEVVERADQAMYAHKRHLKRQAS